MGHVGHAGVSRGANEAQNSAGVIAAALLAGGRIDALSAPLWATVACAAALTLGTAAAAAAAGGAGTTYADDRAPHGNGLAADDPGGRRGRSARAARRKVDAVSRGHWFLPEVPDVLGLLAAQVALTVRGMDAFAAWAASGGDPEIAATVRAIEHEADTAKGALRDALRDAFVTPLDPEDLFALSRGTDWILNHAKDAIGESEVMGCPPDAATAAMADLLAQSVRQLDAGVAQLAVRGGDAGEAADAAVKAERHLEKAYRTAMGALAEVDDLRLVMGRQELYRRCSRMGEAAVDVAERLIYAGLKEH